MIRPALRLVRAMWLLAILRTSLKMRGFQNTMRAVEHRVSLRKPRSHRQQASLQTRLIHESLTAIATAAAVFPGRARCLEQSLALYYWLQCSGVSASIHFGVQPRPFRAHCWVAVDDEVIGETDDVRRYVPLPALLV